MNYLSPATSTAIVRAPRAHVGLVWAALTFVTRLALPPRAGQGADEGARPVVVRVVHVSGTIRKAEDDVIRQARALIDRARAAGDHDGPVADLVRAAAAAQPPAIAESDEEEEAGEADNEDGDKGEGDAG